MGDPEIGTLLGGKFVIEGILGRGGMGVVYAARHQELDQRVAIKCLLPHALAIPDVVERFAREARAAARIQGEHVARVIDVGRFEDGTPYIVMEHLQGQDLSYELAAHGSLPVADAVRYVLETCEALAQAHAMRIVHRDLKPSNLFLAATPGRRPIVKVLDFGISKVVDPNANALTKTSSVMGTPYYMSPEQLLSSKSVDERSDIWALGVILYELLMGTPPFTAETAPEIIAKIVQNTPVAPRERRPELPAGLEAVIQRCLCSKVDDRYANVAQLAMALGPFADVADRESVGAIARVLGESNIALDATMQHAQPQKGSGGERTPLAPMELAQTPSVTSSPAASAAFGTAPSLALSSIGTRGKQRAWALPVAGVVVLMAAGGVVVTRSLSRHDISPSPSLSPSPTWPAAVSSGAPSATAAASAVTLLPSLPPMDPLPSSTGSVTMPGAGVVSGRPSSAPPSRPASSGAATSSRVSSTPAQPTAPAPSHNPLDLGIK